MSARVGSWQPAVTVVSYFIAAEKCRRFGRLEGVGSALGDDVPFALFLCLLADFPGWHAIVRKPA